MNEPSEPIPWLTEYFERYRHALFGQDMRTEIIAFKEICRQVRKDQKKLLLAGNGASASIASHAATDFTKQGRVRAMSFNEANFITAFANDYGYENWVARAIDFYADPGDVVVLISSSGRSSNMINASRAARERDLKIITFTGFAADNPLKQTGDLNFWVDSRAYNVVENIHSIWITAAVDLLIGKAEYPTS